MEQRLKSLTDKGNGRLQAIQHELVRLGELGRKVVSTEQMREKHRIRLHLVSRTRIVASP